MNDITKIPGKFSIETSIYNLHIISNMHAWFIYLNNQMFKSPPLCNSYTRSRVRIFLTNWRGFV